MKFLNTKQLLLTPIFLVASTFLQIVLLLLVFVQTANIGRIASQKTPTLVELADGSSARVAPMGHSERMPSVIKDFVGTTLVGLMDWTGTLPPQNVEQAKSPQLDPGVPVGSKKISTGSRNAAFALSEDFRVSFLKEIAHLTPQGVFSQGKIQSKLIVRHISEPEVIGQGKWKSNVVANLVIFENGDVIGEAMPFDRTIFVRAVDTPPIPLGATYLQQVAYFARKAGLEIYQIQKLKLVN